MSTLKVNSIQHPSSSTPAITLDSTGAMTGSFPYPNRNLLYNGAMQVAQRGTSTASITTAGYFTADRWYFEASLLGTWTQSVESDAPTGSGLRKSIKLLCTTADTSPVSSDVVLLGQFLEGQDLQRIAKGTASAQQLTLSFWVKSNTTGTYIAELVDSDNTRRVSASYTISASATWEQKKITFPADTTGAFDNDNAASLSLFFWLGAGPNFTGGSPLQTAWGTATNTRATGQINLASAINNYWQITGVQLETGSVATPFEFKSYGQELRECQRYFIRYTNSGDWCSFSSGTAVNTSEIFSPIFQPVSMRTIAIASVNSLSNFRIWPSGSATPTGIITSRGTSNGNIINLNWQTSGLTTGYSYSVVNNVGSTAIIDLSAEL